MEQKEDFGLGEALAGLIDALVDRREEWIRINGSEAGFNAWCAEQVNGVKWVVIVKKNTTEQTFVKL